MIEKNTMPDSFALELLPGLSLDAELIFGMKATCAAGKRENGIITCNDGTIVI